MGAMHSDVPESNLPSFIDAVIQSYAEGVHALGHEISGEALGDAISIQVALRFARFVGQANTAGDALPDIVESLNEAPFEHVMTQLTADSAILCARAEEALARR